MLKKEWVRKKKSHTSTIQNTIKIWALIYPHVYLFILCSFPYSPTVIFLKLLLNFIRTHHKTDILRWAIHGNNSCSRYTRRNDKYYVICEYTEEKLLYLHTYFFWVYSSCFKLNWFIFKRKQVSNNFQNAVFSAGLLKKNQLVFLQELDYYVIFATCTSTRIRLVLELCSFYDLFCILSKILVNFYKKQIFRLVGENCAYCKWER